MSKLQAGSAGSRNDSAALMDHPDDNLRTHFPSSRSLL